MKANMGLADKAIRLALAAVIVILYFAGQLTGVAALILGIIALAFLLTSIIGWCPAYASLGISTLKKEKPLR